MTHVIHVTNVIRYILVFVVNLLILLFVHSYFNMVVMIVLLVLPVVSIFIAFLTVKNLSVGIEGGAGEAEVDEAFPVNIVLSNHSVFPVMNVDIDINMENELFHVKGSHRLSVPSYARASDVVDYEISEAFVGVLEISIRHIYVSDWLGFVRLKKKCEVVHDVRVFPTGEIEAEPDMTALADGMSEAEETRHKGNDFSEVVDVREYQPGDRLQNIHWKLSAGRDELMVKERESMSSDQLVVCVELANNERNVLNDLLKAAYGLGSHLISEGIPFTMYYWSSNLDDMVETRISSRGELHEWMNSLFYETPYSEDRMGFDMLQRLLGSDKRILSITSADDITGESVFTYGDSVKGYISE